jgi:iron complex outermembrane receptor protein
MNRSFRILGIAMIGIILLCATESAAQQLSLSGTVRDADGVVPEATVTLFSGGATPRTARTDRMGTYSFGDLAAGYYELSFSKAGYDTVTRTLTLTSNTGPVDAIFAVGALSAFVTVTDVAGKATASRLEIADRDLPVQVSSIPQQLLQQQGVNDMATALRNASGVQTQRLYGVYEQYTIRGFNAADVLLVDGMRTEAIFNRFNTQLNNVESIEVLKGPSSVLYGGDALGGAINVIRKKPQGTRAYDLMYKGGRFNSHQVAGGATGPLAGYRWLYRVDASHDYSDGWRGAGANRLNVSPSLTFLMSENARVTVHQSFIRDNFKGDGGVPVGLISTSLFDPGRRFSLPDDFALIEDSQTNVFLNAGLSTSWEFRNGFLMRRTSEEYFVTEGVYFDPDTNSVPREGLYFHHRRRPYVNQSELVGRLNFLNMRHTLLLGYDYRHFYTRTDVTEDGGFYEFTPISLSDFRETNPRIATFPIARETYQTNRIHATFWQDQIDVSRKVKINLGGRFDDFDRDRYRTFTDDPGSRVGIQARHQTAYTYRAGIVYAPTVSHQLYFSSNSSFTPVIDVPPDGSELKPRHGRGYDAGYRWHGWDDRIRTSIAYYHIEQNNLTFTQGLTSVIQAGKQTSRGIDVDFNGDLGHRIRLIVNYGYTIPKFDEFVFDDFDYRGKLPRFAQKHAVNAWLHKSWVSGFSAALGTRYVGPMFTDNENTVRLGGWTTISGSVGYRRDSWEWTLNVENLFKRKRYFTPSDYTNQVYPGAPINVFSTIRFRFS